MRWRSNSLCRRWHVGRRTAARLGTTLFAAASLLTLGRTVRAQQTPTALSLEAVCRPAAGEIGLQGTVQNLSADKRHLTLLVTLIRTPDGKKTPLATPRSKDIDIAVGAAVFRAVGDAKTAQTAESADAAVLDTLAPGSTMVCLGANSGPGNPLLARSIVVLRDAATVAAAVASSRLQPGKNLIPAITDREEWWVLPIGDKARAESSLEEETLKITVSVVDDVEWHVILSPRKALDLVSGAVYRLSFRARADKEHPYLVQSQVNKDDFHNTGLFKRFTVTTEWQPYSFVFTAKNTVAGHDSCPSLVIGKETGTLYVKDMVLEVVDTSVTPGNLLRAVADPEGWTLLLMHGAQASLEREKDRLRVSISKATGKNADAQVVQYGIHLVEGQWYTVRFRARAPIERTLRVSSGVTKQPYHDVGLERTVKIGPAEKTYVLTFQAKKPQDWPTGLTLAPSFLIGDAPGTLWLSHIVVVPGKTPEQL